MASSAPRGISSAEKAACEAVADFLARGPAAFYDRLAAEAPLRLLPRQEALKEIEVRTGPAEGSEWQLQTANEAFAEHGAVFSLLFPSQINDVVTLSMIREHGGWKIKGLTILAEVPNRPKVPVPTPKESEARPLSFLDRTFFLYAVLAPLLASAGAVARKSRRRAGSILYMTALVCFAVELVALIDPRWPARTWKRMHSSENPNSSSQAGLGIPFVELRQLLLVRRAMAAGEAWSVPSINPSVSPDEVRETAALWKAQSDFATERAENVAAELADLDVLKTAPLAELLRARIAAEAGDPGSASLHYHQAIADNSHDAFAVEESLIGDRSFTGRALSGWIEKKSRDSTIYYLMTIQALFDEHGGIPGHDYARQLFQQAWALQPLSREEVISAGVYGDLLKDAGISALVNLTTPEESKTANFDLSRDPMAVPAGSQALASGSYFSLEIHGATLGVPGGIAIAPRNTLVVAASEWDKRADQRALTEIKALPAGARFSGIQAQGRVERAVKMLASHNRWGEVLQLTDWVKPDADRVPLPVIEYRLEALTRVQRVDQARALASGPVVARAMQKQPDADAVIGFAELLLAAGSYDTALELYKKAATMKASPDIARRVRQLELRQALAASSRSVQTAHFDIRCSPDVAPATAQRISQILESELTRLMTRFALPSFTPIRVNVLSWNDFSGSLTGSDDILGMYDGDITIPFASIHGFRQDVVGILTHELTHAVVAQASSGNAPHWLQEGLAERMELVERQDNIFHTNPPNTVPALAVLDATLEHSTDPDAIGQAYVIAQTFVRFLESKYGADSPVRLIAAFREGADTEDALQKVTGQTVTQIDNDFRSWGLNNNGTFIDTTPWPYGAFYAVGSNPIDPSVAGGIRFSKARKKP